MFEVYVQVTSVGMIISITKNRDRKSICQPIISCNLTSLAIFQKNGGLSTLRRNFHFQLTSFFIGPRLLFLGWLLLPILSPRFWKFFLLPISPPWPGWNFGPAFFGVGPCELCGVVSGTLGAGVPFCASAFTSIVCTDGKWSPWHCLVSRMWFIDYLNNGTKTTSSRQLKWNHNFSRRLKTLFASLDSALWRISLDDFRITWWIKQENIQFELHKLSRRSKWSRFMP